MERREKGKEESFAREKKGEHSSIRANQSSTEHFVILELLNSLTKVSELCQLRDI